MKIESFFAVPDKRNDAVDHLFKKKLLALSNILIYSVFCCSNFFYESLCSLVLFAELKVNFDDAELLQLLCILHFTLYGNISINLMRFHCH